MSEHAIELQWKRTTPDFDYETYDRNHSITYSSTGKICASAAVEYHGDAQCLDPEQAFVTAMASCHMLTFLALMAKKRYLVDSYSDQAVGILGKNPEGKIAITKIILRPAAVFSGEKIPALDELKGFHERAHANCFIANSVASCVEVVIEPQVSNG